MQIPDQIKKPVISIVVIIVLLYISQFSKIYFSENVQIYFNYFEVFLGIAFIVSFAWIGLSIRDEGYKKINSKLSNLKNDPDVYSYSMPFVQLLLANQKAMFIGIPSGVIILGIYFYQMINSAGEFLIQYIVLGLISVLLVLITLFTSRFRVAIDSKNIYFEYSTFFRKNWAEPKSLAKIRKHYIEHIYYWKQGNLIIRTDMGPYGEQKINVLTNIFRPDFDIDLDPNIKIKVRNQKDVDEILKRLNLKQYHQVTII